MMPSNSERDKKIKREKTSAFFEMISAGLLSISGGFFSLWLFFHIATQVTLENTAVNNLVLQYSLPIFGFCVSILLAYLAWKARRALRTKSKLFEQWPPSHLSDHSTEIITAPVVSKRYVDAVKLTDILLEASILPDSFNRAEFDAELKFAFDGPPELVLYQEVLREYIYGSRYAGGTYAKVNALHVPNFLTFDMNIEETCETYKNYLKHLAKLCAPFVNIENIKVRIIRPALPNAFPDGVATFICNAEHYDWRFETRGNYLHEGFLDGFGGLLRKTQSSHRLIAITVDGDFSFDVMMVHTKYIESLLRELGPHEGIYIPDQNLSETTDKFVSPKAGPKTDNVRTITLRRRNHVS